MKTSLAARLEELIENSPEKQFNKIYTDLKDYQKKHFIEFRLMRKISLMDDLVNVIEEQKLFREKLKRQAMSAAELEEDYDNEEPEDPKQEESWMSWWRQRPQKPQSLSFTKAFIYVVGLHICLISCIGIYGLLKPSPRTIKPMSSPQSVYEEPFNHKSSPKEKGPLSDALSRR